MAGIYRELQRAPLDPIMAANERWPAMQRAHPDAIKTTIGVLVGKSSGRIWRPEVFEHYLPSDIVENAGRAEFDYLPQLGSADYREGAARLIMGNALYETAVASLVSAQTLGGTTTLTLAAKTLVRIFNPEKHVTDKPKLLYEGGWKNHEQVFGDDFEVTTFSHLNDAGEYNHDELLAKIAAADQTTTVLLQDCGTNDDGIDRTPQQWDEILDTVAFRGLPLILDTAYAGLAKGFASDRYPLEAIAKREIFAAVGISNSKNLGLYDGRIGLLAFMNAGKGNNPKQGPLEDILKQIIRATYSSPPRFPAQTAGRLLINPVNRSSLEREIEVIKDSLLTRRQLFAECLPQFPGIAQGRGLFTRLLAKGFSKQQFAAIENRGVLVLPSSRINIGGITQSEVPRVGAILNEVLTTVN